MRKILIALFCIIPTIANAQLKAPPNIQQFFQNLQNSNQDIKSKLDALNAKLPTPLKPPSQVNSDIDQAIYALDQITVADLQTGIQVFKAMNNFTGSNCYQAILNVVQANVEADKVIVDANNISPDNVIANLPIKHVFTVIAKYYNLVIASQAGSELQSQCAAMKQAITSNGPGGALMGSSVMSKVLPFLKLIGIAG